MRMKQYLAVENVEGLGEFQLVFSATSRKKAKAKASINNAKLCGEITESTVTKL